MRTIEEIALEVAEELPCCCNHLEVRTDGVAWTPDELKAFAKELLATIQREAEPENGPNNFVQRVPDHCDRIVWRNKYYSLPPLPVEQAGAVPEGWRLVPIEPTKEMLAAGESESDSETATYETVFAAMLAASPQPPKGE